VAPYCPDPICSPDLHLSADSAPRRAIVVPNTKLAYLARLAFADEFGDNRVFYNDMAEAFEWLKAPPAPSPST
jgi:hypothetical protein